MKNRHKPRKAHDRKHKYVAKKDYKFPPIARPPAVLSNTLEVKAAPIATRITDEDHITWERMPDAPEFPLPWKSDAGIYADHGRIAMALPAEVNHYPL